MPPRTWDAATYDRISESMERFGRQVIARMELDGGETVLDAGCGSGRVTAALVDALPRGRVVAVDSAASMVETARRRLDGRADVRLGDLLDLDAGLREAADAVLCTATLHWIEDHDAAFAQLRRVLRPGGRLAGQCGGEGNVERIRAAAGRVGARAPFAEHLAGWPGPWHFPGAEATRERLLAAGFSAARCWVESAPYEPEDPREYIANMVIGPHRERLPEALREPYADAVMDELGPSPAVDYVRLNFDARA